VWTQRIFVLVVDPAAVPFPTQACLPEFIRAGILKVLISVGGCPRLMITIPFCRAKCAIF
jgi:hypothetical protein